MKNQSKIITNTIIENKKEERFSSELLEMPLKKIREYM